jgi:catechol 2,3-dioxygenase-like lactoylglutathione lyase family enzyme
MVAGCRASITRTEHFVARSDPTAQANTMLIIETVHHVSLPVSDLERARKFYGGTLGLTEMDRPAFAFAGAWYRVGDRSLHLIVREQGEAATFRRDKGIDSRDAHFAIRVRSYSGTVAHLESHGFRAIVERNSRPSAANPKPMRLSPAGAAGFPQIYILDPDRNVIEINAETAD